MIDMERESTKEDNNFKKNYRDGDGEREREPNKKKEQKFKMSDNLKIIKWGG